MANSQEIRVEIVTRLLNDAAFFNRFLQDPDTVLAEFPDLDKFDGRYLKDKISDWASLTAVAERFGVTVPERPSAPPEDADADSEPRLQMVLQLQEDAAFFELFRKDPAAALSAYHDLEEEDAQYIQERVTDAASLQAVIDRFQTTVQSVDLPSDAKGIDLPEERPSRVINTGFAPENSPAQPVADFFTPLQADQPYYFWFEVGQPIAESIAIELYELPDDLPPDTILQIAIFGYENEFEVTAGADMGELRLTANGDVLVEKQAFSVPGIETELAKRRLFFPARTPKQAGYGRFRCNIYYQQTLLQSYQIVARVDPKPVVQPHRAIWLWHQDYNLSKFLSGHQLEAMGENNLSIMVNDNGNGTHGFRFMGQNEFKNDASLGEDAVANLQNWARGALRKAAWGDEQEYKTGKKYLYGSKLNKQKLKDDLLEMAQNGHRAFDALFDPLVGDSEKSWEVMDWMVKPGQVQIATKENARIVIPAAMFYDYPYLDGNVPKDYSLCPEFEKALDGDEPLEKCACFQGNCPTYDDLKIVCPSGFWGFRHSLGLPVSVKSAPDAPLKIGGSSPPKMAVSVSTDPNFTQRPSHEKRLQEMGIGWEYADSRDKALDMLKATESQVVYFYCHGGLTDKGFPYLSLGSKNSDWFTRGNLRARRIRWQKVRPLVFINGCHTTQITPERALDFVTGFVQTSRAAGVIGTEITIFESIATQFAEECLRRFMFGDETLGEAVRGARLHMLKNGNPLGLVYILYALPALKLS